MVNWDILGSFIYMVGRLAWKSLKGHRCLGPPDLEGKDEDPDVGLTLQGRMVFCEFENLFASEKTTSLFANM